ncbi:probable chitinase 10 [Temnothorax curvispinosus]|uniref:Probable chitinase 10 n=1 Tax=Temnothorax curvispinosus TaxID=300111 RepID=A0A6J1QTN2_9HYME|nr:probable chitinase 10 [Temnothorax curvispinosus]
MLGDCSRGPQQDSENFIGLLEDLSEAFTSQGLLLSIAASKIVVDRGYTRIPLLARHVDWIAVLFITLCREGRMGCGAAFGTSNKNEAASIIYNY